MRIDCIHGYFKFTETQGGQLSKFVSLFGLELARAGDHFTFLELVDAPTHSLAGGTFLGCPTLETFEGEPWEVMRENGLVYDFNRGLVVPILTIAHQVKLAPSGSFMLTNGMIVPGSVTEDGSRVRDYAAFFAPTMGNFLYSEVSFE